MRIDARNLLSELSIDHYVAVWRQREAVTRARNQRLAQQARIDAGYIAAMLREQFGATRVVLFGSLVKGRFGAHSDIDLAVSGLPPDRFFSALAQTSRLSEFPVDLKPLEELSPHFLSRVLATGEEL